MHVNVTVRRAPIPAFHIDGSSERELISAFCWIAQAVNDPPVLGPLTVSTYEDSPVVVTMTYADVEVAKRARAALSVTRVVALFDLSRRADGLWLRSAVCPSLPRAILAAC